jgi:hypothetical protein
MSRTNLKALGLIGLLGAAIAGLSCTGDTSVAARQKSDEGASAASNDATSRIVDVQRRFQRGAWTPLAADASSAADTDETRVSRPSDLRVELPERASGVVRIEDPRSRLSVAFSLQNALDRPATFAGGVAVYADAAASGASLFRAVTRGATEDFFLFEARPLREEIVLELSTARVAGLRLVDDTLELLDPTGTPRLRVAPPFLVDSRGEAHAAILSLRGCSFDDSPKAPWGRRVVSPCADAETGGSCHCELSVAWDGRGIRYPALLDPKWTLTGMMAQARQFATSSELPDGRVLVVGGQDAISVLKSSEIYDPGTATWATGPTMATPRTQHAMARLSDGRVLVVGGHDGVTILKSAELFDVTSGKAWQGTGSMAIERNYHVVTALLQGGALVTGGTPENTMPLDSAEIFDPAGTWSYAGKMSIPRETHTATLLPSGDVVVVGGSVNGNSFANTDVYHTSTNTWTAAADLHQSRYYHTASLIGTGAAARILVAGGRNTDASVVATAEMFEPEGTWTLAPSMSQARSQHQAVTLSNGSVLVTGGAGKGSQSFNGTELFAPQGTWTTGASLNDARAAHVASLLPGGAVLVAGGTTATGVVQSAEVWQLVAQGAACAAPGECLTGSCVDSVCCDKPCSGACNSCVGADTGLADGVCGLRQVIDCKGFACDPASGECLTLCSKQDDCDAMDACGDDGKCAPDLGICDSNHTVDKKHGASIDCHLFRCDTVSNNCWTACVLSDKCVAGASCGPDDACHIVDEVPAPIAAESCGCREAGAPVGGREGIVLCATVLLGLARRRRSFASRQSIRRTFWCIHPS